MTYWNQARPSNDPGPAAPDTTTPITPALPAAPTTPTRPDIFSRPAEGFNTPDHGYHDMSQEQVDAMTDPGARIGRGIDFLGNLLFGSDQNSLLKQKVGPVQFAGDVFGTVGNAVHGIGNNTVVAPIEAGATALSHIPLGWVPGGADSAFDQIGAKIKDNPAYAGVYQQWQAVQAAAQGDPLNGGNLKGNFNADFEKMVDDTQHDSTLGSTPDLAIGKEEVGSVGGALSLAINSFLGIGSNTSQRALGAIGAFDPGKGSGATFDQMKAQYDAPGQQVLNSAGQVINVTDEARAAFDQLKAGKITEGQARDIVTASQSGRDRVDEIIARQKAGLEVSDVEKQVADAVTSGLWSKAHAEDWIISHGQGITRNPIGQIAGTVLTDPLTAATIGAGSIASTGAEGIRIAEAGGAALENAGKGASIAEKLAVRAANSGQIAQVSGEGAYQKLALTVARVQAGQMGPAFRLMRGMIDPLAVYQPSTVARATTDLYNGTAASAYERAMGFFTVSEQRALAREVGMGTEMDSAIGSYAKTKANEMVLMRAQKSFLEEGMGEDMITGAIGHPDDYAAILARNAGRDGETQLTDYIIQVAKNTFTPEEQAILSHRLASTFGNDAAYWEGKMAGKSLELKSSMHAATYQRTEVALEQAKAKVDPDAYKGTAPLADMVLTDAGTLDDVNAQALIKGLKSQLAGNDPTKIASANAAWNAAARKYSALDSVGYATGGRDQLNKLIRDLEAKIESGGITKRLKPEEEADPELRPIRDMLDRHSMPGANLTPEELAAKQMVLRGDAQAAIEKLGWQSASTEKFFAAIRKASKVTKSNGRSVGETVYTYPKGEYAKMRLFLSPDGKAGFAIKEDGDLVSVFNGGDVRGAIKDIIPHLGDLGATKLDAFDESGRLPELYAQGGFKEVRRAPWDPQYAPKGWTGATPDVVYMERPVDATGVQRLWNIGFRPKEDVAWGVKRDLADGRVVFDRVPTTSHIIDAVPGRHRFSDTVRNALGQSIAPSKAERIAQPIDSMEAFINTMRDGITGQRLVNNMQRRFERSTFDAGIPKSLSSTIWAKARDVAALDTTTIKGIKPDNLWQSIADDIPREFRLADGGTLNIHIVMDHLLRAAEGDLRIMGLTSKLSQRIRTALHAHGDASNMSGQLTVTRYNQLRYAQPMFLIQRMTDAPYYSIFYGVTPVGKGILHGPAAELEKITENLGRTGLARDFSVDMPEYATKSNFTAGIKSAMQDADLKDHLLDRIREAPNAYISNNMTNMLHARLGDMVKGVLDNIGTAAEKADPEFQAEMLRAGDDLRNSFGDWRRIYSEQVGHVMDDNEVGLRYMQDILNAWRRHVVNADGTQDFSRLVAEGQRYAPSNIGAVESIKPDILAQELGYSDVGAMRADYTDTVKKVGGEFQVVKGDKDLARLHEDIINIVGAHPNYARRAGAYFGDTWDGYWYKLSRPVDKGGLDISPHYAKEAQEVIAREARARGMDPWEYLSGVISTNIGAKDLNTAMGELVGFLKAGREEQPLEAWASQFRATLHPSAQETLLHEFESANPMLDTLHGIEPAEFKMVTPKSAPGKAARPPVASLPDQFKAEPGYAYRVENPEVMRMGLPTHEGVTVGKPTQFYEGKNDIKRAIYRIKDDGTLGVGRHGPGGADRLTTRPIPPNEIEMLASDGTWRSLGDDPISIVMSKDFPDAVRNRAMTGVPHPNPEVEGYMQAFSKWVQEALPASELGEQTRSDLRRLVEAIPTNQAVNYNRSQALVISLLKNKIEEAQNDVFRLAEMQTQRTVIERSLNHPLWGLYPASYMWGKVLPETVKFLSKNPYAATYIIADVQRAIAIQREYDPDFEHKMSSVDRSAGSFLADYLTPGLPWSDHAARMSPMVRDILKGQFPNIWPDELKTVSPDRWIAQVRNTMAEVPGAINAIGGQPAEESSAIKGLEGLPPPGQIGGPAGGPPASTTSGEITGPTPAGALAPILQDDLTRLQSILLSGKSPG